MMRRIRSGLFSSKAGEYVNRNFSKALSMRRIKTDHEIPDTIQNPSPEYSREDINQNCRIVSIEFTDLYEEDLFHPVIWIDIEKIDLSKGIQNMIQIFGDEGKQNIEQGNTRERRQQMMRRSVSRLSFNIFWTGKRSHWYRFLYQKYTGQDSCDN